MAKGCVSLLLGVGFGLGSLGAVLASPQGNGVPHNVALHGQVRTKDGRVIPVGVTATLQTRGGVPVESRPADSNGNFEFSGLTAGYYILSVKAEKFQIFEQSLDICDGWIVYRNVNVVLVPLDKSETTAASAPPLTDEAARRNARKDFEKGARAWREKKLGEARTHLGKAVAEHPCYARALAALAEINISEHKPDHAEALQAGHALRRHLPGCLLQVGEA